VKVDVFCIDPNGIPIDAAITFAGNVDKVPAGASVPFSVTLYHDVCVTWVVGASGFDMKALTSDSKSNY
jgi:hypothetical protein